MKDYRASRNANELGYVARGLLRELLDECWEEGFIPADIERLAKICRCPVGVLARAWPKIDGFFSPLPGLDGELLQNRRLEFERTEQDKVRVKRAAAGRIGAEMKSKGERLLANAGKSQQMPNSSSRAEQSSSAVAPPEGGSSAPRTPAQLAKNARALIDSGVKLNRLTAADAFEES